MSNPNLSALTKLAERMTAGLPETGHDHTRKLYSNVGRLAVGMEALDKMHKAQSPTETAGAHQKKIMQAAAKYEASARETFNRMQEITRDGLREIQTRINQKTKRVQDSYAAEIRAQFRALDTTARIELLNDAVKSNNGPVLAALLDAPSVLTGISPDMNQRYTLAHVAAHAPAELEEQQALTEAFSTALLCVDTAKAAAQAYADPAKLAAIEAGEQSAADAAAAFTRATT